VAVPEALEGLEAAGVGLPVEPLARGPLVRLEQRL
jgi:hypothetical protein